VNYTVELIEKQTPPRPSIPLTAVSSITLHWIGPYPSQSVRDPVTWWVGQKLEASAHFIVKGDAVLNCIPITEVAWHCGSKGNYTSIGIEVIPASTAGEFSYESMRSLRELLGLLPQVELLRHYDWTGKDCPLYYTDNNRWEDLKKWLR
jgi:N-acetylmuramoyl-L-alanine amidase